MKDCEWCSESFEPNVSYQIYCSVECRDAATRKKILDRYKEKRFKTRSTAQKNRTCSGGCGTLLSIYNDNGFCTSCMVNKRRVDKMLKELRGLFDYEQE